MKKYLIQSLLIAIFIPFSVIAAPKATKPKLLFVVHAPTGQIIQKNNIMTLTLKPAPKVVRYFTDRPIRKAGFIPLSQFLQSWNQGIDSFKKNHPNAALIGTIDAKAANHHIDNFIILSQPIHNKKVNSLTFTIDRIGPTTVKPQKLKNIVLFIDEYVVVDNVSKVIYFNEQYDLDNSSTSTDTDTTDHDDTAPIEIEGKNNIRPI